MLKYQGVIRTKLETNQKQQLKCQSGLFVTMSL